jgi:hypothetical protein
MNEQFEQNASLMDPFGQFIAASLLVHRRLQLAGTSAIS